MGTWGTALTESPVEAKWAPSYAGVGSFGAEVLTPAVVEATVAGSFAHLSSSLPLIDHPISKRFPSRRRVETAPEQLNGGRRSDTPYPISRVYRIVTENDLFSNS